VQETCDALTKQDAPGVTVNAAVAKRILGGLMRRLFIAAGLVSLVSCGGGGSSSTPTSPTTQTTPTATNRAPVITSASVSPAFGIADLQAFTFAAIANDPDGDAVSYSWNAAGNTATAATPPPIVFRSPGGSSTATITVTDSKGLSASSTVNFTVGSMSGRWTVTSATNTLTATTFDLTQGSSGIVTGNVTSPVLGTGRIDPAQPGSINAAGTVQFRYKVGNFTDATITGTMDTTGTRVVGAVNGSGFTGQAVVLQKQG